MNESWVTLQGWVGGEVNTREAGGTRVSTFRVGCTPRYLRNGMWVDGQTSWYTVHAWRTLGNNVAASVHKGDAVVVHGRVRVDVWERQDKTSSVTWVVDATFVGHDLNRGTSAFHKTARAVRDPREAAEVREMVHAYEPDGPQLDAAGEPVAPAVPAAGSGVGSTAA